MQSDDEESLAAAIELARGLSTEGDTDKDTKVGGRRASAVHNQIRKMITDGIAVRKLVVMQLRKAVAAGEEKAGSAEASLKAVIMSA